MAGCGWIAKIIVKIITSLSDVQRIDGQLFNTVFMNIQDVEVQDKSSDIEQQPLFGDRKYSNTLPQKRWNIKPTGTSYNLDKV